MYTWIIKYTLVLSALGVLFLLDYIARDDLLYIPALINAVAAGFLAFSYRHSAYLFPILFLYAYIIYSIFIGRYFAPEIAMAINNVISYDFDKAGLSIIAGVTALLSILLKPPKAFNCCSFEWGKPKSERNAILSIVSVAIGVSLQLLFIDSQNTTYGGRASYSPIYEYSVIFYIFSLYFARGYNRFLTNFVVCVAIFFAFRDFSLGHRATGIQLFLVCYFFVFARHYTFLRFLFVACVGVPLMTLVAIYRSNWSVEDISIMDSVFHISASYFAFDTAYFAYIASLSFLAVREIASISLIFSQLLDFIMSQFVIGTVGESLYAISKKYFQHANGGILPFYLFYYFGLASVPLTGWVIASYLNMITEAITKSVNSRSMLIFCYIFTTSPRWLLYSPNPLLRGVLIFITVYFSFYLAHKFIKNVSKIYIKSGKIYV